MILKKLVPIVVAIFLAGCASSSGPSLPSTTYIANSEGSRLPADMSPGQRLTYLNQGMTKAQVIAVMGVAHSGSTYPPSLDCLSWLYMKPSDSRYSYLVAASVIFYKGNLVSTEPNGNDRGCQSALSPSDAERLLERLEKPAGEAAGKQTQDSSNDERVASALALQMFQPMYEDMKKELAAKPKDTELKARVLDMKKLIDDLKAKMSKSK